jgi:hypothetical protein
VFVSTELILAGFEHYGRQRAGAALVPMIQAELKPNSKVFSVGTYEQSLTFYLKRTVTLVDYWDEFTFGLQQQPELSIPTVDGFVRTWTADAAAGVTDVAIIRDDIFAKLSLQQVPMRVMSADARRIVISNQIVPKP